MQHAKPSCRQTCQKCSGRQTLLQMRSAMIGVRGMVGGGTQAGMLLQDTSICRAALGLPQRMRPAWLFRGLTHECVLLRDRRDQAGKGVLARLVALQGKVLDRAGQVILQQGSCAQLQATLEGALAQRSQASLSLGVVEALQAASVLWPSMAGMNMSMQSLTDRTRSQQSYTSCQALTIDAVRTVKVPLDWKVSEYE